LSVRFLRPTGILRPACVHFDDTPVNLVESHNEKPRGRRIREARFWAARALPRDRPWTVFDFTVSRAAMGPVAFFCG